MHAPPSDLPELNFERDGARRLSGAALDILQELEAALAHLPQNRAGLRLAANEGLRPFLEFGGSIGTIAAKVLGHGCRPVRAILFDKTVALNWSLGWHQDRTISIAKRRDVPGFGPWTIKNGVDHVEPPFDLLARMVTLRIHLDDVSAENAPLQIALGSHLLGRVAERDIDVVVAGCRTIHCLARAGDVWLYATPILHASSAASKPARRRVLQVDYAAEMLPGCLEWAGI